MAKADTKKALPEFEVGSGNVFADLDFADAEEMLVKSGLASQIDDAIRARKLTRKQAAALMGIDEGKVSLVVRGRLKDFSIQRLMSFLVLLGDDVEIVVHHHQRTGKLRRTRGSMTLATA